MKTLVVVLGPTGVGKTELCLNIAKHLKSPIINADSRQIFAEMPIGTAAPTKEQQREVLHYFVGNHNITDYYSAAMFEEDAINTIDKLFKDGHNSVLMSGGSMMYIDAVCKGIDDIPTIDESTREKLKIEFERDGLDKLVDKLKVLDPEHWLIVDKKNPRRVIHALEICMMTGKTYTSFRRNTNKKRPFNILKIGLNRDREELYERINKRVLNMIDEGLVNEVLQLYNFRNLNALNTVGYKEVFDYLDGLLTLDEATRQIQSNSRRYMRKQLTWFKRDESIKWFNPNNVEEILKYIDKNV
ncbi:MAG: tRNA (adenosine(37)-N6)-dimethylallyltransferase MiaA [Prevotella sp.]|jgi:tRNA dimethylallyltransferase|nr:tRNA (adenosine(37)-N6)-dimethylallyltransferase MiaA [Prevotella sp.]MDY0154644.1 tRNA (adenosine(37)-N6)-dimethylallyltransferase MiaA [Prevotella sp.]